MGKDSPAATVSGERRSNAGCRHGLRLGALTATALLLTTGLASPQDVSISLGNGASLTERAVQLVGLMTVLSLAPSILVMMTSFTRIVVVLSLLRSAIGLQSAPPNAVMISLALFLTAFIMAPTFQEAYTNGIEPVEQIGVQFGHAVQMQGRRMVLKGQAAEYDGRNVAAIDRQARVARQGGLVVVGSATNAPLFVGFPRVGAVGVCLCFFCHFSDLSCFCGDGTVLAETLPGPRDFPNTREKHRHRRLHHG